MGSLKDEMRENHQLCGKTDDGERPGGSDGSAINASRGPAAEEESRPKVHVNASCVDGETGPESKEPPGSGSDTDFTQVDATRPTREAEAAGVALRNHGTTSEELQSAGDRKGATGGEKVVESIAVPVPPAADPSGPRSPDLRSPAPHGQHHVRTQVSLEVVQCRSAATSPMTPPEGAGSFFFPCSFGASAGAGAGTQDAELQAGRRVELCSVATSPMTPKTPSASAFPELTGREVPQKVRSGGERGEGSASRPADALMEPRVTVEESNQPCKRMGSMEQDITILVTQYGTNEEGEAEKEESIRPIEPEMVKIDECEEPKQEGKETAQEPQNAAEGSSLLASERSVATTDNTDATKPPVPESPAPFGCHNIRTQVSLEVVQCQSVATSPMTPPGGDQAFCFPGSFGTRDAELQVGQQVECRSVATAPMTPRTPTAPCFPEIRKEVSVEEKIEEEEEEGERKEEAAEEAAEDTKEETASKEEGEDKGEEPVQEVSWDDKGMTWEVYGAVVEVSVLGSAIQKHLEKQVKKQKRQPSMPPPPPLTPSATPLSPDSAPGAAGSGRGAAGKRGEREGKARRHRRNPFRLLMENVQQPHCCSRAHTTE
ncbi:G protein-regulated inducer of neurite outgrowth 1 [Betta splendens]|uniref:G protein-regulated inducer of neurite outgrowth 1 n=1 Tax=Betta splendens TaxID=158456 RepID=A0A6P7NU88_BETSP|nr:G protein-regulated inducer of neurite outgrowth 1 [Betta splendens]